jgi:hypothetical protein
LVGAISTAIAFVITFALTETGKSHLKRKPSLSSMS